MADRPRARGDLASDSDTWVDELLSLNAFQLLAALIATYLSLRRLRGDRMHRLERIADAAFLLAVTTLALDCLLANHAIPAR